MQNAVSEHTIKLASLKKTLRNTKVNVPLGTLILTHSAYFIFFYSHFSLLHEYFSRLVLVH